MSPKSQTMSLLSSKTRYFEVHSGQLLLWLLATRQPRLIAETFVLILSGGRPILLESCIEIYSWRKLYENYIVKWFHFMWRRHITTFLETHRRIHSLCKKQYTGGINSEQSLHQPVIWSLISCSKRCERLHSDNTSNLLVLGPLLTSCTWRFITHKSGMQNTTIFSKA